MLKVQSIFIILACLFFSTGCETTASNPIQVEYAAPTVLETSSETRLVESLPKISEGNSDAKESIIFKNDRLLVRKTLIESDQVGGEITYDITLDILKDIENLGIEELIPESFHVNQVIPTLTETTDLIWHFKVLRRVIPSHRFQPQSNASRNT